MSDWTADDWAAMRAELRSAESDRLFPYDDATGQRFVRGMTLIGNLTIGTGRNLSANGISSAESDQLLDHDISNALTDLIRRFPWFLMLNAVRQRAVVEMHFNLGLPTFLQFHRFLAAMQVGDYQTAATEVLNSAAAKETGPTRYPRIAQMIRTGAV